MATTKTKNRGVPATAAVDFDVHPPFKIMEDNRRQFIRIDIAEPILFSVLKGTDGGFWSKADGPGGQGEILNISAGGILLYTAAPILEGSILSLSVQLEGCKAVDHILGKVKRVEIDSDGYLVGIESITREKLADFLSSEEIDELPSDLASFTERLRALLNQYVYSKKLTTDAVR